MSDLESRANRESQLQGLYDGVVSRLEEMRLILAEDLGCSSGSINLSVSTDSTLFVHFGEGKEHCTMGTWHKTGGTLHSALTEARAIVDKENGNG